MTTPPTGGRVAGCRGAGGGDPRDRSPLVTVRSSPRHRGVTSAEHHQDRIPRLKFGKLARQRGRERRQMMKTGEAIVNPRTGQRMIFRQTAGDTGGALLQIETVNPRGPAEPEHVHPHQESRAAVLTADFWDEIRVTRPPERVQRVFATLLALLGRLRGYRAGDAW
jgi:hypothetical protein